jgi:hypothetical protein
MVVMEQVPRGSKCNGGEGGPVACDNGGSGCAAKGTWGGGSVLQRGRGRW